MNLTTISISGLALAVFAVAIAVRATEHAPGDPQGWRNLPPPPAATPAPPPADEADAEPEDRRALERAADRTARKDERARDEAVKALDTLRRARRRVGASHDDVVARTYWESRHRTAALRLASACRERRRALEALHALRSSYAAEAPRDR